jgi:hypothetical protein
MTDRPSDNLMHLMQMYCDGECSAQERAQVEQYLADHSDARQECDKRIEFQRQLSTRLSATLGKTAAPAELIEKIKMSLEAGEHVEAHDPAVAGRIRPRRNLLGMIFEDPRRGNVLAIAATLAIVAGAVLYGIFGRSIDQISPPSPGDLFASAALFADQEHTRCTSDPEELNKEMRSKKIDEAERNLSDWLQSPVYIADLFEKNGYIFEGGGYCSMEMTHQHAGHIMYRKDAPAGHAPMVSIFVFPNRGQCGGSLCKDMSCGSWYEIHNGPGSGCKRRVLCSTDGKLVYLLVCCNDRDIDGVADTITALLKAPH